MTLLSVRDGQQAGKTGEEILCPFDNVTDAVRKLEESGAEFKQVRGDIEVVRETALEGTDKSDVSVAHPKCTGLMVPIGEQLKEGKPSVIRGMQCRDCGFTQHLGRLCKELSVPYVEMIIS